MQVSKIKVSKKPRYANCVSRLSTGGHIGTRVFSVSPAFRGRKAPSAPAAAATEAVRASQDRGIQKAAGGSPGAQTGLVFSPFFAPGFKCAKIPNQRKVPREGVLFFGGHIGTRVFSVSPAFRESLWLSGRSDRARLFPFFCAGVRCGIYPPKTKAPLRAPSFLVDTSGLEPKTSRV